jgi:hypothetical protein
MFDPFQVRKMWIRFYELATCVIFTSISKVRYFPHLKRKQNTQKDLFGISLEKRRDSFENVTFCYKHGKQQTL